jgi:hypothetical protein
MTSELIHTLFGYIERSPVLAKFSSALCRQAAYLPASRIFSARHSFWAEERFLTPLPSKVVMSLSLERI